MHKFRNEEGLTLIELLITLAVIAVVFAIAVPVFSNVLAVAEADAATAQQAALDSFKREYATTTLSYDSASNTTTATLNGDVIATIKGDATSAGSGNGGGNVGTVYLPGTDFPAFTFYGNGAGSAFGYFTLSASSNPALLANFAFGNDYSVHVINGSASANYNVSLNSWSAPDMAFATKWDGSATGRDSLPNFTYTVDSISVSGSTITITVR